MKGDPLTVEMFRQLAKSQKLDGFKQEPEVWQSVVNRYLALPALRGFWPMSSMDYTAANRCIDMSGQGNHLTENGTANQPSWNYDRLAPYTDFDITDLQYFSRADGGAANWADVTGTAVTEPQVTAAVRGLTLGGWFWFNNAAGAAGEMCISKFNPAGNQRSYFLSRQTAAGGGVMRFRVSSNGVATTDVDSVAALGAGTWYYVVGRFIPSTEMSVFVNDVEAINAVAIPAGIFDSTSIFAIGRRGDASSWLDGRASMCFLCAAQLSDAIILSLFEQTRALYGV